jgi:NADPH:quinone reductase
VLATASGDNEDILRQLAADVTIDYRKKDAAEISLREQSVKALAPRSILRASVSSPGCLPGVRPFGRIVCILRPQRNWSFLYQKNITCTASFLRASTAVWK